MSSVKLPGFMQRGNAAKPTKEPVGSIRFSTRQSDDICGLEEAMQSLTGTTHPISNEIDESANTNSANASSSDLPALSSEVDESGSSKKCGVFGIDEFELAVEASLGDISSSEPKTDCSQPTDAEPSCSTSEGNDQLSDHLSSITSDSAILCDRETTSSQPFVGKTSRSSLPSIHPSIENFTAFLQSATSIATTPIVIPASGVGTSVSRLTPKSSRSGSSVAATAPATIHALLDSFSTPTKPQVKFQPTIPTRVGLGMGVRSLDSSLPEQTDGTGQCVSIRNSDIADSHSDLAASTVFSNSGWTNVFDHDPAEVGEVRHRTIPTPPSAVHFTNSASIGRPCSSVPDLFSAATTDQNKQYGQQQSQPEGRRSNRPREPLSMFFRRWLRFCGPLSLLVGLLCCTAYSPFVGGLALGVVSTIGLFKVYQFLDRPSSTDPICPLSGLPIGQFCCSVHHQQALEQARGFKQNKGCGGSYWWPPYTPALPNLGEPHSIVQFRDLPSLSVPHLADEDVQSSASSGPLGSGLGFKVGHGDRLIYKGWMNEVMSYDPETHHISRTHSIFVSLDGTQLRLQRPKRNTSRRSMWNSEQPSNTHFKHQRIYDLTYSRVILLPPGLVAKRLWSRKYPIAVRLRTKFHSKFGTHDQKSTDRSTLSPSPSAPNINLVIDQTPAGLSASTGADLLHPSVTDELQLLEQQSDDSETLYLFGRTCREKEAWYRRLQAASLGVPLMWTPQLAVQHYLASSSNYSQSTTTTSLTSLVPNEIEETNDTESVGRRTSQADALWTSDQTAAVQPGGSSNTTAVTVVQSGREPAFVAYVRYMAKFMPASWLLRGAQTLRLNINYVSCEPQLVWLNALLGRAFWDFFREAYWLERVRDKIQAKLKKIHLPYFINELTVVGIDLGSELPIIRRASPPYMDPQGIWMELDIVYGGGFSLALETNVNLMRLNMRNRGLERDPNGLADDVICSSPPATSTGFPPETTLLCPTNDNTTVTPTWNRRRPKLAAFQSDEEDSADSTTDSENGTDSTEPGPSGPTIRGLTTGTGGQRSLLTAGTIPPVGVQEEDLAGPTESTINLPTPIPSRRRLIRIVDRITRSTYFQKAFDSKLLQRGMELVSNTPIGLQLEVNMLSGTLLLNVPPPPSDRLWYGFRPNPQLRLKARPRVGDKAVTLSRILEWIENKMALEFQRLVVLPNMDDIVIPLLLSDTTAECTTSTTITPQSAVAVSGSTDVASISAS